MKSLLRAALDRPVSVLVASAALVVLGAASLRQLPVSLLPDLERPRLVVVVEDSTRSRDSLSTEIVEALEVRLMALEGVVSVVTQIDDGLARIDVSTDWQTDVDRLRMQAERQFASADKAGVALSVSTSSGEREPVLQVAVSGGAEVRRTEFVRNVLLPELARVPGVSGVRRVGGARERVVVRPVPSALAVRGLTNLDVELALRGVGTTEPLGMVRDGDTLRTAVVSSSVSSLNDLSSLAVPPAEATGNGRDEAKSGVPVPVLGDVAELEIEELLEGGAYLVNDRGALLLELFRTPSANAVLLARRARQSLREVTARAPPGLQIEVVGDASAEVVAALRELALAGLLGLGLGTIVVRLFLGSWVPTLSLMVVVPASVIAAFAAFLFWGVSLDVVALAGLALALGMLVDNSIVVLEAISSRRGERTEDRVELEGTTAVALPLVAALLTTAAVFVPLLYLRGLARAFFGVQAFAIVSALAISLALSLTVTPVLSRVLAGRRTGGRTPRNPGHDTYLILLRVALRRPLLVTTLAVVFATAVLALGWAGLERELVPRGTGQAVLSEFSLEADLDARSVRERLAQVSAALTAEMESFSPSVERLTMRYEPLRPRDPNSDPFSAPGRLRVSLDRSVDPAAVARRIAESLATFPGLDARTRVERALFARTLLRLSGDQRIEVKASTHQRASALARRVIDSLQGAGLATRALVPRQRTAWALNWRTAELAKQGASRAQAERALRSALGGHTLGHLDLPGGEIDVHLEPNQAQRLGQLSIGPEGDVSLSSVAELELVERKPPWLRSDGRPARFLQMQTVEDSSTLRGTLANLALAEDEDLRRGGAAAEIDRSFAQLRTTLLLGSLLVFLTVAALYESLALPFAVGATIPLAAAGSLLALWLTGQSLNVLSFLGVILLSGIVVNNSIVLLSRLEELRTRAGREVPLREEDSRSAQHLVLEAASARYRPIVMTTTTTVLSMLPLVVIPGQGIELRRSLGLAVLGGLISGAFASLFIVPTVHLALFPGLPSRGRSQAGAEDRETETR